MANTPAELTHLLEEIQAKDIQIQAFRDEINKRDAQLQKWVRVNGGHVRNPKEEAFTKTINDCYDKCEILQAEKCGLSEKAQIVLDRQIKRLDISLRSLSMREEFPGDWNGPSLLSASGHATGVSTPTPATTAAHQPLQAVSGNVGSAGGAPNVAQMRLAAQAAGASGRTGAPGAQTPTNVTRTQREGSSEASKRRKLNTSLSSLPAASSNLRQSSLGPGTPKAGTPVPAGTTTSRAGSQQPARPTAGNKKASTTMPPRKVVPPPPANNRRRDRTRPTTKKSDRKRHLKSGDRATPSTNASHSSGDESGTSPTPSSLPRSQADGTADRTRKDGSASPDHDSDEDEEDTGPYCTCQRPSFGEMVCCDNDNCEFQWFHYDCVGIKTQPEGEWLCPDCKKLPRDKIVKGSQ